MRRNRKSLLSVCELLEVRRFLTTYITVANSGDYSWVNPTTVEFKAHQSIHVDATAYFNANPGDSVNHKVSWDFGDPTGKYNVLPGFSAGHIYDTSSGTNYP